MHSFFRKTFQLIRKTKNTLSKVQTTSNFLLETIPEVNDHDTNYTTYTMFKTFSKRTNQWCAIMCNDTIFYEMLNLIIKLNDNIIF